MSIHLTDEVKGWVLEELMKKPVLIHAARELGLNPLELRRAIDEDEDFAALVSEAEEIGVQNAEEAAWDRGVNGVTTIVYKNGAPVMIVDPETGETKMQTETKHSDKLLELVLKSRDDRYGDRQKIEMTGQQVLVVPQVDSLEDFRDMLINHKNGESSGETQT